MGRMIRQMKNPTRELKTGNKEDLCEMAVFE